jgi:hypothetical protein
MTLPRMHYVRIAAHSSITFRTLEGFGKENPLHPALPYMLELHIQSLLSLIFPSFIKKP